MNQKNSFGLNTCFMDEEDPIKLFKEWFDLAKKKELNDPNALALATSDSRGNPNVRMVLLKDYDETGFVFYTNLNSPKSKALRENPKASICFHWKSLLRQIRIFGEVVQVSDKDADAYYNSRKYGSRIGAWASKQSEKLVKRDDLNFSIESYKKKFPETGSVPRPKHWSGWKLKPKEIEFWLDGENRIHERLKYKLEESKWTRFLLSP